MNREVLWRLSDWIGVASYAVIVFIFIRFWMHPGDDAASHLRAISLIYPFEFVLLHSGIFMAVLPKRVSHFVLVPFYGLIALAISAASGGLSFLLAYVGIIAMRMRFAFSDVSDKERGIGIGLSIVGIIIYFGAAFITAILASKLPHWGLTPEFLSSVGYVDEPSDAIISEPHQEVALAVVYFSLIGVSELFALKARRKPG